MNNNCFSAITTLDRKIPSNIMKAHSLQEQSSSTHSQAFNAAFSDFLIKFNQLIDIKEHLLLELQLLDKSKYLLGEELEKQNQSFSSHSGQKENNLVNNVLKKLINSNIVSFSCYTETIKQKIFEQHDEKSADIVARDFFGSYNTYIDTLRNSEGSLGSNKNTHSAFSEVWSFTVNSIIASILELISTIKLVYERVEMFILISLGDPTSIKNIIHQKKDPYLINRKLESLQKQASYANNLLRKS